jgi:hypothetical protein
MEEAVGLQNFGIETLVNITNGEILQVKGGVFA